MNTINIEENLTFREYWNLTLLYNGVPCRWRFIPSGQQRQNYTATIYALIRRLHRQIIPAAKVDNQDPLKKPLGSAAVESNSQTLCMTKGSWPEAKLDYQIDIKPSPVKRQLNLTTLFKAEIVLRSQREDHNSYFGAAC